MTSRSRLHRVANFAKGREEAGKKNANIRRRADGGAASSQSLPSVGKSIRWIAALYGVWSLFVFCLISFQESQQQQQQQKQKSLGDLHSGLPSSFGSAVDSAQSHDSRLAAHASEEKKQQAAESAGQNVVSKALRTTRRVELSDLQFNKQTSERIFVNKYGSHSLRKTLTAYFEPPLNDTLPLTNLSRVDKKPNFYIPLPLRLTTPQALQQVQFPSLQTCHDIPSKLPVDHSPCPSETDPFLPWIHDVFPNANGTFIHFVAHNRRRCNTGSQFHEITQQLQAQIALMQPISVKRISQMEATHLAPQLWMPSDKNHDNIDHDNDDNALTRYRLVPHDEADPDGIQTRFICRFHTVDVESSLSTSSSSPKKITIGETLSTYPFNYEYAGIRKGSIDGMFTTDAKYDNKRWLTATLRFDCPTPQNGDMQRSIANGYGVLRDGTPMFYVDVIPIRTSPRLASEVYLSSEERMGPNGVDILTQSLAHSTKDGSDSSATHVGEIFNARQRWGDRHVLPRVEASGRWENIPICWPPQPYSDPALYSRKQDGSNNYEPRMKNGVMSGLQRGKDKPMEIEKEEISLNDIESPQSKKTRHTLAACLWTSASFTTRGDSRVITDTTARIMEWIEFHLLVGFDHVYIYDNSGAHGHEKNSTAATSLEQALSRFSWTEVTRIDWPFRVCNNNSPTHDNPGERSSQYAAECSCLARYGPHTEWLAVFDTDEYLIPMGKYHNLKDVLNDAFEKDGTMILSFRSTRALPNTQFMEPHHDGKGCGTEAHPVCLEKRSDALFLETYNCDVAAPPKPYWASRAKKQIFRPDYVLAHLVHYHVVTTDLVQSYREGGDNNWSQPYDEKSTKMRFTDELNEAVMLHTKTTPSRDTAHWNEQCRVDYPNWKTKCHVGFPWPGNLVRENEAKSRDGHGYNCFTNDRLTSYWIPRLRDAMAKRERKIELNS